MFTRKYHILSAVATILLVAAACSVSKEEVLELDGTGKIALLGGRERVVCKWSGVSDAVAGISLDGAGNHFEIDFDGKDGSAVLSPVPEGNGTFSVIWRAKNGETFNGAGIEVKVYGSEYEGSLENRSVLAASYTGSGVEIILSSSCPDDIKGMEFTFTSADGNPDSRSVSHLYFCDKEGKVYRMPYSMTREWEKPEPVY